MCLEPLAEAVGKDGFSIFFLKKSCAERPWQRPSAKTIFYFFKTNFFADRPVQLHSAKLATPELGKFFPELPSVIANSTRQRTLCPRPLLAKRPHFIFFPFHINKHIYIYIQ
jgi:hypothetical protein